MKYQFIWYPKCTTCQKAKKWLDDQGLAYEPRPIKEQHPSAAELEAWWKQSGLPLKRFFNTSGLLYKSLQLKEKLPTMSETDMVALLATDGMLVKRPLLIGNGKVLVGFKQAEWEQAQLAALGE
nr:arsenate reductase family protein [uncultured Anaeromusa sp.]